MKNYGLSVNASVQQFLQLGATASQPTVRNSMPFYSIQLGLYSDISYNLEGLMTWEQAC